MNKRNIIENIRTIRAENNDLWLALLKIALNSEPRKTNAVLRGIRRNDARIGEEMRKLIDD